MTRHRYLNCSTVVDYLTPFERESFSYRIQPHLQNAKWSAVKVTGERQPGRPARRWIDDVLMWCDKDIKGAVVMIKDRDNWRRLVSTGQQPLQSPWPRYSKKKKRISNCVLVFCVLLRFVRNALFHFNRDGCIAIKYLSVCLSVCQYNTIQYNTI